MTIRRRRALATTVSGAALLTAGFIAAQPAAAQSCTPQFTSSGGSYVSRLCGMPDYDQRRTGATLTGDGRTINVSTTLAGNGGCHCVPTAFTNLLGYYVTKGVVGSFPRRFDWDGRPGYVARPNVPAATYLNGQTFTTAEVQAYNAATFAIKTLGTEVKTGDAGCGTSWGTVLNYFKLLRPLFPKVYMTTTTATPGINGPKYVANMLAAGGTVSVAYGRYENYTENGPIASWGARKGGHAVTIRGVTGSGGNATFEIADPASNTDPVEAGDSDRFRQSRFATQTAPLKRVFNPAKLQFRWRWGAINATGTTRIFDSMLIAYPVIAVMANGNSVRFFPGLSFNQSGASAASATGVTTAPSELRSKTFRTNSRVIDAAFLPSTGEIAYLTAGSSQVRAVGVGTRETRVIGRAPAGATQLEIDPTGGQIFVGGSRQLVQMDPEGENVQRTTLPSAVQALAYDPGSALGAGRIVSITADRSLRRHVPGTLIAPAPRRLAATLTRGSGPLAAAIDPSGRLVLRRGDSERIGVGGSGRTLSRLGGNGGLAVGDRGTLFTVVGGKLLELSQAGQPVSNSPLSGRIAPGRLLQVTRSGSDVPASDADVLIDERVVDPDFPEMAP